MDVILQKLFKKKKVEVEVEVEVEYNYNIVYESSKNEN